MQGSTQTVAEALAQASDENGLAEWANDVPVVLGAAMSYDLRVWTVLGVGLLLACTSGGDGEPPPAAGSIGAACVPAQEDDPTFGGSDVREVGVAPSTQCASSTQCLVYHFQGRTTCPNGSPCTTPDGKPVQPKTSAQCVDRQASRAVYCSCVCANFRGRTDDGGSYCSCPSGFACNPVTSFAASVPNGASYCIKPGSEYDAVRSCSAGLCSSTQTCR